MGWSILGLRQKVVVISDQCAIAWADSQLGAVDAIRELRALADKGQLTRAAIKRLISSLPSDANFPASIGGKL